MPAHSPFGTLKFTSLVGRTAINVYVFLGPRYMPLQRFVPQ
jgi:hypothetical protein